jgi:hypothetical protein
MARTVVMIRECENTRTERDECQLSRIVASVCVKDAHSFFTLLPQKWLMIG